ncbi:MAG TPA: FKBP-type peptidyl-prolyl cis-trans isomerase [Pseudomonadales bacterium]|jgi:FKBP-type peptidyl-prolyl cis-trans isomerase/plastocyanin|nr:hypothetical protein [Gammaproteobacteria bacterium]MDP6026828.1 FKBP-type peptidyl-prolyl cis-trans isomerase [Pseudomonadales bacterium]MDP6316331.1 FKBP-type peptidyl-prolyl cis-trans isomerase [Pseudomonadales bacterium]MDP7314921.1 FKBP-type peptidyl-prolyl cis-trans isomerase [Pseudomonadales bacterium]HJL61609.1 FKBP-type peptidyl-prolyl cis-trans isomerase [Pseudomonadales bacterium]|tara:strand:- start:731 stop:1774 length:1044 start_codon:yes stop_codon:yes gene_type:complete
MKELLPLISFVLLSILASSAHGAQDYVIEIGHGHMSPDHLLLQTDDRIVFKNVVHMEGGHSVVVSNSENIASSPAMSKGEQWIYEFNDPGNFTFFLKEHPQVTAKATVFTENVMEVAINDLRKEMVSYSIGFDFGEKVVKKLDNLDLQLFLAGLQHAYNDEDAKLNEEEMAFIIVDYKRQVARQAKARLENLADENLIRSREFLVKHRQGSGVEVSNSGLQFKIVRKGHGRTPVIGDKVRVHYKGMFTNQVVFDDTHQVGVSEFVLTSQVLPGIVEGITLMSEGGKIQLAVPPHLGYGNKGQRNVENELLSIEPNATLLFEIELFEIVGENLISDDAGADTGPVEGK